MCGGARPSCYPLASPGAVNGTWNRWGGMRRGRRRRGGYSIDRGDESGEYKGEEEWVEDSKGSLGDSSNTSGASTSGDNKSLGKAQTE